MSITVKFDGKPDKILKQPAFLVGNGIYYYEEKATLPWSKLAFFLLPKKIQDKILEHCALKNKKKLEDILHSKNLTAQDDAILRNALKGITYTEALDFAELYPNENPEYNPKEDAIGKFLKMEEAKDAFSQHNTLVEIACKNQTPILTTNCDRNLIRSTPFNKHNMTIATPISHIGKKLDKNFLMNGYFTTEENRAHINENNIRSTFAIWHIHGLIKNGKEVDDDKDNESFPKSLCLGDIDYNKRINKLNKIIEENDYSIITSNTWLDIFMNNDLIILGLSLDSSEKDIRWLLIQRYFYQQNLLKAGKIEKATQIIFIYRKEAEESEMPCGKRAFFESLGIECIPMETEKIYKFDWISNN